ncbi:hypothetical protein McanMca71_001704 [Microsporum canis]
MSDTRGMDAADIQHLHKHTASRLSGNFTDNPVYAMPYVEAYFDKFHPSWPFLHRATFDPAHEPPILLQSVLMMGLWATGDQKLQYMAVDLHEKLIISIYSQRHKWGTPTKSQEAKPSWPIATYQGILLQVIFAILRNTQGPLPATLTHRLPEVPAALLTTLTRTCLQQGLFFYPSIASQFAPSDAPDVFVWLGIEEVKRLALTLYKVSKICYTSGNDLTSSNKSPGRALSLADLRFGAPDSDDLWNATSGLAAELAGRGLDGSPMTYCDKNDETNWISNITQPLQTIGTTPFWL